MANHPTLTTLLNRLKQYHPEEQAGLLALESLLQEYRITNEVFAQALDGHIQGNAHLPLH
jgi:hypothetical protein